LGRNRPDKTGKEQGNESLVLTVNTEKEQWEMMCENSERTASESTEKAPGDKGREQGENRENLSFPGQQKGDENTGENTELTPNESTGKRAVY